MRLSDEAWRREPFAYPFRTRLDTRYGDMDANAHLNNVAIARLVEEARVRFHAALAAGGAPVRPGAVRIAHVAIDFVAEGRYPGPVDAGVALVHAGRTSWRLGIGLFQEGRVLALADSVMVQPGEPPDDALRQALAAMAPRLASS